MQEPLTSQPPGEAQVLDFVHGLHVEPWGDDHGVRPCQVGMLGDLLQAVGHPALGAQLLLPADAFCSSHPVPAQLGKVVNVPAGALPWRPGGPIQTWLGGRPNRGCWWWCGCPRGGSICRGTRGGGRRRLRGGAPDSGGSSQLSPELLSLLSPLFLVLGFQGGQARRGLCCCPGCFRCCCRGLLDGGQEARHRCCIEGGRCWRRGSRRLWGCWWWLRVLFLDLRRLVGGGGGLNRLEDCRPT